MLIKKITLGTTSTSEQASNVSRMWPRKDFFLAFASYRKQSHCIHMSFEVHEPLLIRCDRAKGLPFIQMAIFRFLLEDLRKTISKLNRINTTGLLSHYPCSGKRTPTFSQIVCLRIAFTLFDPVTRSPRLVARDVLLLKIQIFTPNVRLVA